jgi:hypothetical protein
MQSTKHNLKFCLQEILINDSAKKTVFTFQETNCETCLAFETRFLVKRELFLAKTEKCGGFK